MSRIRSIAPAIAIAIVAIAAGMLLSRAILQRGGQVPTLASGTLLTPPKALPAMTQAPPAMARSPTHEQTPVAGFIDQDRRVFDAARLQGRWSLLFFGFTSCPDICPTTLGTLARAEKLLADLPDAQRPQVVLVSVDARRDTPEQLASYVKFFSPSFTGITAPQHFIEDFARQMGVVVVITPLHQEAHAGAAQARPAASSDTDPEGFGEYTVDHSTSIFLIDPLGRMRALFSAPHIADTLAEDYRRVIAAGT